MSRRETPTSTSATILYRPFGLASSIAAGILAGQVFKRTWGRMSAGPDADAPQALQSEYSIQEVLVAATVQGALFAGIKALTDRGGARLFQRWTGEWPGD